MRETAQRAGIPLVVQALEPASSEAAYRRAIVGLSEQGVDAIIVSASAEVMANLKLIAEQIKQARVPALYPFREFVEAGGLMAYTFDLPGLLRHMAHQIDDILKGKNPGEIPYYQSSITY
jgi:putative ABC transport system substrate-binding protein